MRRNIFKKISAAVLSLTMIVGMTGVVPAAGHAANGANIASNISWDYFSVISYDANGNLDSHSGHVAGEDGSRKHPYCWYHALTHINTDKYPNGQVAGTDFATEGWVAESTPSSARFYAKNTGWDGQYNGRDGSLVGDNQWGLRMFTSAMNVEKGRSYTLSFKYTSTLKGKKTIYETDANGKYVLDSNGDKIPKKDEKGNEIQENNYKKHINVSVINPANNNGLEFSTTSGCTSAGFFVADSQVTDPQTVTVKFTVPSNYAGSQVKVQFALGSYVVSYPDELAMTGNFSVSDFKIAAGTQYSVKYTYGSKSYTKYVNAGAKTSSYVFPVKSKTFSKFTKNGSTFSLSTPITGNTVLNCVYVNTPKPAKAKVKFTAQKKKVKLALTKIKNCVGYEIKYANNKKMKKAKTKTTTAKTYTIKKLKSKKKVYIQVKGYNYDSAGQKVYSSRVLKKTVKVK